MLNFNRQLNKINQNKNKEIMDQTNKLCDDIFKLIEENKTNYYQCMDVLNICQGRLNVAISKILYKNTLEIDRLNRELKRTSDYKEV